MEYGTHLALFDAYGRDDVIGVSYPSQCWYVAVICEKRKRVSTVSPTGQQRRGKLNKGARGEQARCVLVQRTVYVHPPLLRLHSAVLLDVVDAVAEGTRDGLVQHAEELVCGRARPGSDVSTPWASRRTGTHHSL